MDEVLLNLVHFSSVTVCNMFCRMIQILIKILNHLLNLLTVAKVKMRTSVIDNINVALMQNIKKMIRYGVHFMFLDSVV